MKKKLVAMTLVLAMAGTTLAGCGGSKSSDSKDGPTLSAEDADKDLDYTYGEDETFHSDEAVKYSMMYSDHENYPYNKDWLLWKAIEEKTNVTFDLTIVARTDYNDKVSASVNSGSAPYIIPKTYDSTAYEDSGQIVPISDWVQYMPNYQKCVKEWGMEDDLQQILASNGKYYRLPGMWETTAGGYSLAIRKDVFEAAGVDLSNESSWTWDDFYEALKKVKVLSGGEKVRCMMSKLMLSGANVLVMDDPTNHLDIESITSLNKGMENFKGALLFSSHDHELLSTVANRIIEFKENGKYVDKMMNYDEYLESVK